MEFDCAGLIAKKICSANCCGCVGMPLKTFEQFKDTAQRQVIELADYPGGQGEIVPFTEDMKCVFLKPDCSCAIYDSRPEVCQNYGHLEELQCPYFNLKGRLRSPAKQRRMQRIINHTVDSSLRKLSKISIPNKKERY
jgi:hypothetical protein